MNVIDRSPNLSPKDYSSELRKPPQHEFCYRIFQKYTSRSDWKCRSVDSKHRVSSIVFSNCKWITFTFQICTRLIRSFVSRVRFLPPKSVRPRVPLQTDRRGGRGDDPDRRVRERKTTPSTTRVRRGEVLTPCYYNIYYPSVVIVKPIRAAVHSRPRHRNTVPVPERQIEFSISLYLSLLFSLFLSFSLSLSLSLFLFR